MFCEMKMTKRQAQVGIAASQEGKSCSCYDFRHIKKTPKFINYISRKDLGIS